MTQHAPALTLDITLKLGVPPIRIVIIHDTCVVATSQAHLFLNKSMAEISRQAAIHQWKSSIVETRDGFRPADHAEVQMVLSEFPGARIAAVRKI